MLKAISILEIFSLQESELGIADIARRTEIPKTTVHRILSTLTEGRLLEQNAATSKYRIGPKLYALGSLYLNTTDLLISAEPVIKKLNELTGEVTNLSILDEGYLIFVMREESKQGFRWSRHVGSVVPAYASGMGRALLSELTDAEIDSLYPEEKLPPLTPKTIQTKTELKLELEKIRKAGISIDMEGSTEGVFAIASIIRNVDGKAVAAISIAFPIFMKNEARCSQLEQLVRLGSGLISYRLGYQGLTNPVHNIQEIVSWWEQNQLVSVSKTNG